MKTSEFVKQEINAGNLVVADIAAKLNAPVSAVTGSMTTLKKQGYVLHVVDGVIVVEHNPDAEAVVEPEVITTHVETTVGVEYETKHRGRKTDPNSIRQKAFALIKTMIDGNVRRKDMKHRLVDEFGLKEGHANMYIQKVRSELGLVHPKTDDELVA